MPQYFRTGTPMGDWRSLKFICDVSAGILDGSLHLVQETVGLVFVGAPVFDANGCREEHQALVFGEEGVLIYHIEKVIVAKLTGSGEAALPGDKAYWSGVTGTGVSPVYTTGWYWIGIFTEPADADDDEAEIDLLGNKATLLE